MRIAWFTHRYYPCIGGAEVYGRAMVRRFVEHGHRVDVITSDAHDLGYYTNPRLKRVDEPEQTVVDGASVRRIKVRHYPLQRYFGRLLSYLPHWPTRCQVASYMPVLPGLGSIRGDYDAVFGVGFPFTNFSYAAFKTARAAKAPLILTPFLHLSTPGDPVNRSYTRPHQIRLLREADLVINPTPRASETVGSWGIPADRLLTMPMAIEAAEVTGGDGADFRRKWSIPEDAHLIGQLGALDPNKGSCDLILAVERLIEAGRNAHLILAGNPTRDFHAFLESLPPAARPWLTLTGPLPEADKPAFYAALDVFSMPSRTDSYGIVYLEAWANGLPVVAADAGGVPEVIDHGRTGLLVPFGEPDSLAREFTHLLDDPAYARALGDAGMKQVQSGFNWQDRFEMLDERLRRMVSERKAGPRSGAVPPSHLSRRKSAAPRASQKESA